MCPSGVALATALVAIAPEAPGRFSTSTGWPSRSESLGWMMRATVSLPPPGAKGTMSVTGRVGNACAKAAPVAAPNAAKSAALAMNLMPVSLDRFYARDAGGKLQSNASLRTWVAAPAMIFDA